MFQQAGTAQLNDYFRPLSERGGSRVFFCRIAGYGETVAAFLRRYYEAARRSGVIIDGRIPNPTPDNLSYFNEMMGSGFQMDRDFLSQRLKKWLPRMTDGQRDAVVTAMYATLDDMRRAGKNDNMLRNAYMKYMCWLYYKFERIVNVLGGETLPKILYAGDVSHYELQLLTVLSRAGADIVLLECGGDQAYLTVDPQSALSHLYQAPGLGSFPAGFGVKQLQAELEREVRRQRLYGTPPSLSPCTNAWVQKAELNAALTAVQARGNDPRFFCNLFLCQYGVEDNLTYTNDLFAFYQSLQGGGRRICVVNGDPAPPGPEEIAAVKRGNYASAEQLAAGLAANIRYPANVELQRLMTRAFIDLVLEEGERCGGSVSKLTSRAVYRGHSSPSSISMSTMSAMEPPQPRISGVWSLRGLWKVALASRARPMTLRQSGRLGVISNSTTWSSAPMTLAMSSPGCTPSSFRTKMPSVMQWGNSFCSAWRSARVQMVPSLVL